MTIKEIEERTGMDRANIRFYEKEGLLSPVRLANGYRDYTEHDVDTLLRIKLPSVLDEAVSDIGAMATPLALLTMGAQFDVKKFKSSISVTMIAAFCRVIVSPVIVIGVGILLGFRGYELGALYVLFSAPTAVSSYVMAKNMGGNGNLASQVILVTTFLAMFTITFGIFLLKSFALI